MMRYIYLMASGADRHYLGECIRPTHLSPQSLDLNYDGRLYFYTRIYI